MNLYRSHVLVCAGTGCHTTGCDAIVTELESEIKAVGLENEVKIVKTGCFGLCSVGPIVIIHPEGSFYSQLKPEDVKELVDEHLLKGRIVKRLLYQETVQEGKIKSLSETGFYAAQMRVALRNCGMIDPEQIDEYIGFEGYSALGKVLTEMTREEVIDVVKKSGLRGRGGAGFPTGLKWEFAKNAVGDQKYVVCNADEGDPGAFMDRSILEGDPHSIIEAMAIAGYAVGANQGHIYVRAEYPIAIDRIRIAINQAKEYGLLGTNIFQAGFDFDIDVRIGAGAFVCGEETALLTSIEGNRGEPKSRPPFPAVKGLFGKPTLLNNVETFANIPQIFLNGPEWFASMGTETSKGTKIFALAGNITNIGLVEVPMGIPLRTIIEEIGGGIPNGRKFKAAQTGGPSGGCIPAKHIDIPIDYENLRSIGSMMGSGGLIVLDDSNCMVDIALFFLDFTVEESCGKCTPCRVGTKRLYEILERISKGQGEPEDINRIKELGEHIKSSSLCGLGQTAPNPALSTLEFFLDEYEAHINEKRCPAGVCKDLLEYEVIASKCVGCTLCKKVCPVDAIAGAVKEPHVIDKQKCIKCDACVAKCKFNAIVKK